MGIEQAITKGMNFFLRAANSDTRVHYNKQSGFEYSKNNKVYAALNRKAQQFFYTDDEAFVKGVEQQAQTIDGLGERVKKFIAEYCEAKKVQTTPNDVERFSNDVLRKLCAIKRKDYLNEIQLAEKELLLLSKGLESAILPVKKKFQAYSKGIDTDNPSMSFAKVGAYQFYSENKNKPIIKIIEPSRAVTLDGVEAKTERTITLDSCINQIKDLSERITRYSKTLGVKPRVPAFYETRKEEEKESRASRFVQSPAFQATGAIAILAALGWCCMSSLVPAKNVVSLRGGDKQVVQTVGTIDQQNTKGSGRGNTHNAGMIRSNAGSKVAKNTNPYNLAVTKTPQVSKGPIAATTPTESTTNNPYIPVIRTTPTVTASQATRTLSLREIMNPGKGTMIYAKIQGAGLNTALLNNELCSILSDEAVRAKIARREKYFHSTAMQQLIKQMEKDFDKGILKSYYATNNGNSIEPATQASATMTVLPEICWANNKRTFLISRQGSYYFNLRDLRTAKQLEEVLNSGAEIIIYSKDSNGQRTWIKGIYDPGTKTLRGLVSSSGYSGSEQLQQQSATQLGLESFIKNTESTPACHVGQELEAKCSQNPYAMGNSNNYFLQTQVPKFSDTKIGCINTTGLPDLKLHDSSLPDSMYYENAPRFSYKTYKGTEQGQCIINNMVADYRSGMKISEMTRKYNTSTGTLYRSLKKEGVGPNRKTKTQAA